MIDIHAAGIGAAEGHGSPLRWDDEIGLWTGGFNAVAVAQDWNGDGQVDLMVHYPAGGGANHTMWGTYLYLHSGQTDKKGTSILQEPLRMPFDGKPLAWDWNQDGKMDCIADGVVYLNQGKGIFQMSTPIHTPAHAASLIDWNQDGIPDVLCSESLVETVFPSASLSPKGTPPYTPDGIWKGAADRRSVRLYIGIPSDAPGVSWRDEGLLRADGLPIEVLGGGHAVIGDWDLDGDSDLLVGAQTELIYYQNIGSADTPKLSQGKPVQMGKRFDAPGLFLRPSAYQPDPNQAPQLFLAQEDGNVTSLPFMDIDKRKVPAFQKEVELKQQNALLDAGSLAVISVVDWDGDGDLDIVSGNSYGSVYLFENHGSRHQPRFASRVPIRSGHHPIRIQAGANGSIQGPGEAHFGYTCPVAVDWNQDDIMDLVLSDVWGNHSYYYGSPFRDALLEPEAIKVTGWEDSSYRPAWMWKKPRFGELVTQWRCQPAVVDWNMDATYDLVSVDAQGYLAYYKAYKDYPTPLLHPPDRMFLDENGAPIRITEGIAGKSGRARIVFADWDGDHDLDIIRGCTTAGDHISPNGKADERVAVWYENTDDDLHFIYRGKLLGKDSISFAGHATSPAVVDWDGDGKMDLLLGTEDGLIYYFNRTYIESTFP